MHPPEDTKRFMESSSGLPESVAANSLAENSNAQSTGISIDFQSSPSPVRNPMGEMEDESRSSRGDEERGPVNGAVGEDDERRSNCSASSGRRVEESEIASIKSDLKHLSHQVYRILLALHVPPCTCDNCSYRYREQNDIVLQTATQTANGHLNKPADGHSDSADDSELSEVTEQNNGEVKLNTGATLSGSPLVCMPQGNEYLSDPWSSLINTLPQQMAQMLPTSSSSFRSLFQSVGPRPPHYNRRKSACGRKSKYCTAAEKAAVADYASVHGASAAARKFNIPPAVAAYYHRKITNRVLPKGRRPRYDSESNGLGSSAMDHSGENPESGTNNASGSGGGINDHSRATPPMGVNGGGFYPTPEQIQSWMMNGGSPGSGAGMLDQSRDGFLHHVSTANSGGGSGRGRGRPKLIGDDLDARLLVHLSEIRKEMSEKMTADTVLRLATNFIRKESPGMLMEDGGHIHLKPTWAMKVLMRMNEAEKMERMFRSRQKFCGQQSTTAPLSQAGDAPSIGGMVKEEETASMEDSALGV